MVTLTHANTYRMRKVKQASLQEHVPDKRKAEIKARFGDMLREEEVTINEEMAKKCDELAGLDAIVSKDLGKKAYERAVKQRMEQMEWFGDEAGIHIEEGDLGPVEGQAVFRCGW
jgi:hypothetical protein